VVIALSVLIGFTAFDYPVCYHQAFIKSNLVSQVVHAILLQPLHKMYLMLSCKFTYMLTIKSIKTICFPVLYCKIWTYSRISVVVLGNLISCCILQHMYYLYTYKWLVIGNWSPHLLKIYILIWRIYMIYIIKERQVWYRNQLNYILHVYIMFRTSSS
jgi:hypothetical protein